MTTPMNLKYTFGSILAIPLLPIMYYQGKSIRSRVPDLPEAKGASGVYKTANANRHPLKIITIGESTMAGVGVETHEEGFTGAMAKELSALFQTDINWRVYARSGYTAQKVSQEIVPAIKESDTDLVVIGLGGNDAFRLKSPDRWKKDVSQLITVLQAKFPKALIVFANMPPIREFPAFTPLIRLIIGNLVEIFGEELQELVKRYKNVLYSSRAIKLEDWTKKYGVPGTISDFFSDGVHPSKLTYQIWAKDLAGFIYDEKPPGML